MLQHWSLVFEGSGLNQTSVESKQLDGHWLTRPVPPVTTEGQPVFFKIEMPCEQSTASTRKSARQDPEEHASSSQSSPPPISLLPKESLESGFHQRVYSRPGPVKHSSGDSHSTPTNLEECLQHSPVH